MGTWGGGRMESITGSPHGAWGRGGSRTGVAGQGEELGVRVGVHPDGQEEGARVSPALYVTAITSGLVRSCWSFACSSCGGSFRDKNFEGSCCTSLRAFQRHEQAPKHLCLGRRQVQAFRPCKQALPPRDRAGVCEDILPGKKSPKLIYLPAVCRNKDPASSVPHHCVAPSFSLASSPASSRKQERRCCRDSSVDPPRINNGIPLSSLALS